MFGQAADVAPAVLKLAGQIYSFEALAGFAEGIFSKQSFLPGTACSQARAFARLGHFPGQVIHFNAAVGVDDEHALDEVAQLAHVARPGVSQLAALFVCG